MNASRCRHCGVPIEFFGTVNDRRMPLDLEPVNRSMVVAGEPGNVVIRQGIAHVLSPGKRIEPGEQLRVPHFASCEAQREHGARGRETAVDREHRRLDEEAAAAADRDGVVTPTQWVAIVKQLRRIAATQEALGESIRALSRELERGQP